MINREGGYSGTAPKPGTLPSGGSSGFTDGHETENLESLLRRGQNRLRPANRITHPLPSELPLPDDRSLTQKIADWLDDNGDGIFIWGMASFLGFMVLCLVGAIWSAS